MVNTIEEEYYAWLELTFDPDFEDLWKENAGGAAAVPAEREDTQ
jgi:hypothetical protein